MTREIKFYENYFVDFYLTLDSTVQEKEPKDTKE